MNAPELFLRSLHLELQSLLPEGFRANFITQGGPFIQVLDLNGEFGPLPVAIVRAVTPGFVLDCKYPKSGQPTAAPVWQVSHYAYEDPGSIDRLMERLLLTCAKGKAHYATITIGDVGK